MGGCTSTSKVTHFSRRDINKAKKEKRESVYDMIAKSGNLAWIVCQSLKSEVVITVCWGKIVWCQCSSSTNVCPRGCKGRNITTLNFSDIYRENNGKLFVSSPIVSGVLRNYQVSWDKWLDKFPLRDIKKHQDTCKVKKREILWVPILHNNELMVEVREKDWKWCLTQGTKSRHLDGKLEKAYICTKCKLKFCDICVKSCNIHKKHSMFVSSPQKRLFNKGDQSRRQSSDTDADTDDLPDLRLRKRHKSHRARIDPGLSRHMKWFHFDN